MYVECYRRCTGVGKNDTGKIEFTVTKYKLFRMNVLLCLVYNLSFVVGTVCVQENTGWIGFSSHGGFRHPLGSWNAPSELARAWGGGWGWGFLSGFEALFSLCGSPHSQCPGLSPRGLVRFTLEFCQAQLLPRRWPLGSVMSEARMS